MRAEITSEYPDENSAKAVANALQPDNIQAPDKVKIKTTQNETKVVTKIEIDGRVETLLATIDDLLSCTATAEGMI